MKRLFSIILSLFLIVSLSLPAFATDSGSDSGTGSMAAGGIDQDLTGFDNTVIGEGSVSFGEYSVPLSSFPEDILDDYPYLIAFTHSTWHKDGVVLAGSTVPFVAIGSDSFGQLYPGSFRVGSESEVPFVRYFLYLDGSTPKLDVSSNVTWSFNVGASNSSYLWSNHDIVFDSSYRNIYPESHGLLYRSGSELSISDSTVVGETTYSFPSSSFNNFSFSDGVALYAGAQVGQSFSGDLTYSGSYSSPYVDINLPLSAWTDTVPELYDRVSIDGSLLFDFAAGLTLWCTEGEGQFKYIISDLVPSSFQILINGEECADTTQYPFDSSLRANIGHVFSEYQHLEVVEEASVTTDKIAVDSIDTLGFRIYLSSVSGSNAATFENDLTFAMLWPYVYANFTKSDGSLGLPALTFYEVEPEPDPSPEPSEDPDPEVTEDPDPEVTEDPDPEVTEDPDPEPSEDPSPEPSEDPDPEPSFEPSPDPDITVPSEMELLGSLLSKTVSIFQFKFTIFDYEMSFWGILLFLILSGIVIALIRRFTQ